MYFQGRIAVYHRSRLGLKANGINDFAVVKRFG